jgi:peptidoglycan/xylan/chitin deacetylase (PgdA/CDA1 family)
MKRIGVFLVRVLCGLVILSPAVSSCATIASGDGGRDGAGNVVAAESMGDGGGFMDDGVRTEAAEGDAGAEGEVTAGILLGFDDNYYAGWEAAFPLFDRYGAKVTFFVQGNPAFCRKALEKGHDIGYHTENHVDLRNIDRAAWSYETFDSASVLRESGVPLTAFAYPFGFSDSWMDEELLKVYAIIRGFGTAARFYTKEEAASGLVMSKSIDNTMIPDDDVFYEMTGDLLRTVKDAGNLIIPLTTHNIDDDALWGITFVRLEFLLRTASEMGLRFYTYRELTGQSSSPETDVGR